MCVYTAATYITESGLVIVACKPFKQLSADMQMKGTEVVCNHVNDVEAVAQLGLLQMLIQVQLEFGQQHGISIVGLHGQSSCTMAPFNQLW